MREVEVPVAFPDRRALNVKISPTATVLDLKRAICRSDAKDVLEAGDNADLLSKRFTAPATFRLILRGMELANDGTLEYYHLTTKGRSQQAVRVCPKHESLVDDDEVLCEDFAIPETVAHLEEEQEAKKQAEAEVRAAAKLRHATFHMQRAKKAGSAKSPRRGGSAASSVQNSPSRSGKAVSQQHQQQQQNRRHSDATTSGNNRPESSMTMNSNRSTGATPEPTMPAAYQQNQQQQREHGRPIGIHGPNSVFPGRVALQPMPADFTAYNPSANTSLVSSNGGGGAAGYPHHHHQHTITNSPTRGLQPLAPVAAAIFALPLDDGTAASVIAADGSVSPDILTKMKAYLQSAERGDAPLPQILPLPSTVGGHLSPPRGTFLQPAGLQNNNLSLNHSGSSNSNKLLNRSSHQQQQQQRQQQYSNTMNNNQNDAVAAGDSGECPGGAACKNQQKLNDALIRIQQLEKAVESYKQLVHQLAKMQEGEGGQQGQ